MIPILGFDKPSFLLARGMFRHTRGWSWKAGWVDNDMLIGRFWILGQGWLPSLTLRYATPMMVALLPLLQDIHTQAIDGRRPNPRCGCSVVWMWWRLGPCPRFDTCNCSRLEVYRRIPRVMEADGVGKECRLGIYWPNFRYGWLVT